MALVDEKPNKLILTPKNETQRLVLPNKAGDFDIIIRPVVANWAHYGALRSQGEH
jgi:hypothetical protein